MSYFNFQLCNSKVEITTVKGDHRSMLTGESVDKITEIVHKLF